MGAYLYQMVGKAFLVQFEGKVLSGKMLKYVEKPYYDLFEYSEMGRIPSYLDNWDKSQVRRYLMMRGRWAKTTPADVGVLAYKDYKRPIDGSSCYVYKKPIVWTWDDPDFGGGIPCKIHYRNGIWVAERA